jgi:polyhydroxyalkanoate synthesis repressor PhaR
MATVLIKKYGNRRLYDTEDSRYITLDELAAKIRHGAEVRVVDAKTNDDLTQSTLTQLILEGRSAQLLPVGLLTQLIRIGDDALGEFFSRYVTAALDMYIQAKRGVQTIAAYNPLASWMNPFAQSFGGYAEPPPPPPPRDDVADLRRELEELKRAVQPSGLGRPGAKRKKRDD